MTKDWDFIHTITHTHTHKQTCVPSSVKSTPKGRPGPPKFVCVSIARRVFVPVMWPVVPRLMMPPARVLGSPAFLFLSGRPFQLACVSTAISGSSLPFMCGGPDRPPYGPCRQPPPSSPTHTWDVLSVVCRHNGIQLASSRGAKHSPFNSLLKCIHSGTNTETQTHTCDTKQLTLISRPGIICIK